MSRGKQSEPTVSIFWFFRGQIIADYTADRSDDVVEREDTMFHDKDGRPTVGFCLLCDRDFYCLEEVEAHNANDIRLCPGRHGPDGED